MLFLQNTGAAQEPCSSRRPGTQTAASSSGLQELFLDFLYPVHALAPIRRLRWSTNEQHHAAQNIKNYYKGYTSIAADFINGAKAFGTDTRAQTQDASTRSSSETPQPGDATRRRISELLDSDDRTWIYDELWQCYQTLLEMSQQLSPQHIVEMLQHLCMSKSTIDVERAVALFDSIPVQQRRAIHYSHAISAALSLNDIDTAVDMHREASARTNGSIGAGKILHYTVQHGMWQLAIVVWHVYWVDKLHYYTRPDIWKKVIALPLPDLIYKAGSAANFAITAAKSSLPNDNAVAARDFALELIRQTFRIQNINFDVNHYWPLVDKVRALDGMDIMTETMILEQLLSVDTRVHGHSALVRYRLIRKLPTFLPSTKLLRTVTQRLMREKTSLGILMIIEDWRKYHQKIPSDITIDMAKVFARLGQLEHVQNMFRYFLSTHGKPRGSVWYHILLFIHNRRANPEGVVRAFNDLQKDFQFKPTLLAWNYVIGTFTRIGDVDGALIWFNKLLESEQRPDFRSYFLLMSLYAARGDSEAVLNLYQQSKVDGIQLSLPMIGTVVLAKIKDERLAEAEQLVKEASHMDLEGSRQFMWTILLNAYAVRNEVEKVWELYKEMQNAGIAPDAMTYAALLTSLSIARRPDVAHKILNKVMPKAQIKRTSLHYAIVMGAWLRMEKYGQLFGTYESMLSRRLPPTMSTQNIILRASAAVGNKDPTILPRLVCAQQVFEQTMSNLDPKELAASEPRKFVGPDPLNERFFSSYFEYLIFLYGKHATFAKFTELYERYISTSARSSDRDIEASPPIRLLSALMATHLHAGDHQEVERCWRLALGKSEKLVCRAGALTSEPGWVLYSRRFVLVLPLRHYMASLSNQGRSDDLTSIVNQLCSSGFALNSPNWNQYIQHLAQSSEIRHKLLAFKICERELMPNWPGWNRLGDPNYLKPKFRRMTSNTLHSPGQKMPDYLTLVKMAAVYLQAKQGVLPSGPHNFFRVAPKTVDALTYMPRMADEIQISLLRTA